RLNLGHHLGGQQQVKTDGAFGGEPDNEIGIFSSDGSRWNGCRVEIVRRAGVRKSEVRCSRRTHQHRDSSGLGGGGPAVRAVLYDVAVSLESKTGIRQVTIKSHIEENDLAGYLFVG